MSTVHIDGSFILLTRANESQAYLECSVASLFRCPILQMRKLSPRAKCFRSRVSGSLITSTKERISLQSDQPGAQHKATYDGYPLNE